MAADGTQITFLGSTFVAAEEYCFCRFESGSAADVERACELAGVLVRPHRRRPRPRPVNDS